VKRKPCFPSRTLSLGALHSSTTYILSFTARARKHALSLSCALSFSRARALSRPCLLIARPHSSRSLPSPLSFSPSLCVCLYLPPSLSLPLHAHIYTDAQICRQIHILVCLTKRQLLTHCKTYASLHVFACMYVCMHGCT